MDVQRPGWWIYPRYCGNGHPWAPGRVLIAWLPCQRAPAREAQPRGSGHRTIACQAPGCDWTDYEPQHEPGTAV